MNLGVLLIFVPTGHLFKKSAKGKLSKASPSTRQQHFKCLYVVQFFLLVFRTQDVHVWTVQQHTVFCLFFFFLGHIARGQYNRSLLDNAAFRLTFALLKSCQEEGGRRRRRDGTRGRKGWSYNSNCDRWVSSFGWEPKQKEAGEAIYKGLLQIDSKHCRIWRICIVQGSTFPAKHSWGFWIVCYHQRVQKANRRVLHWSCRWWFSSYC